MPDGGRPENILIISDLHLGEDIGRPSEHGGTDHLDQVEAELVAFLDHYATHLRDGRPWRLIVNGDMIDFLSVCLMPEEAELVAGLDPDDHVYGLGTRPLAARIKMGLVLDRHVRFFRALARFLGAGNQLSIVPGNHDVEFHWPQVQEAFRDGLAALWTAEGGDPAAIGASIAFHPWFFFEEGVIWVEHGHQYDGYCSFETVLDPVAPDAQDIDLNVGSALMRYVVNRFMPEAVGHHDLGFFGYLAWIGRLGLQRGWNALTAYFAMAGRLLWGWYARWTDPAAHEARRERHRKRLARLARRFRIKEEILLRLDALRRPPVILDLARLLNAIMLDRLLLVMVAVAAVLALPFLVPLGWVPALLVLLVGLSVGLDLWLSRDREAVDPREHMRRVSRKIRRQVRAPIVVFGHSHAASVERTEDGWYFNTGTWVPFPSPKGLLRAFTHLVVERTEKGMRPRLCVWRDGRSVAFDPARTSILPEKSTV